MARPLFSACLLALAGITPAPVSAQTLAQAPAPGTADQLAAQMRLLGANANDLTALLTAGELSVKLDDLGAAASFFARAEKIDPHNGRAKAGEGSILVHAERPGEALRYFELAERFGAAPAAFAADRGLAYDLIGEPERAQRDYRLALRTAPDEEARRRYALSLAISGKRELADQELQPLLRQSDRGAWRARAFILALGGNVAEAGRIATTMMPPGTAAGLQPFLEKLPTLGPVDRAFAVHFGEVRSTPERVADARQVPALPALGADPYTPRVAVAAVAEDKGKHRPESKRRGKPQPVQVAVATPAPEPLPQAPAYRPAAGTPPVLASRGAAPTAWPTAIAPRSALPTTMPPAPSRAPVTLAASGLPPRLLAPTPQPKPAGATLVGATTLALIDAKLRAATPPPAAPAMMARSVPPPETNVSVAATVPAPAAATLPAATPLVAPVVAAPLVTRTEPAPPPPPTLREPLAATPIRTAPPIAEVPASPRQPSAALSRIVDGLPIPGAELGVGPPPAAASTTAADERATAEKAAAARAADKLAADKIAEEKAAAAKALADKRAADKKAAADRKALADKKAAAAKKAEEEREAAAQRKIERANPERIWVQVAGGANEHDLPKAWAATKAKGGDLFAGHATGWTTPLRFTNRVLAGPFKTGEEARAFVNKAKGAGLSAFTFTSDAGQVVTKLASPSSSGK